MLAILCKNRNAYFTESSTGFISKKPFFADDGNGELYRIFFSNSELDLDLLPSKENENILKQRFPELMNNIKTVLKIYEQTFANRLKKHFLTQDAFQRSNKMCDPDADSFCKSSKPRLPSRSVAKTAGRIILNCMLELLQIKPILSWTVIMEFNLPNFKQQYFFTVCCK